MAVNEKGDFPFLTHYPEIVKYINEFVDSKRDLHAYVKKEFHLEDGYILTIHIEPFFHFVNCEIMKEIKPRFIKIIALSREAFPLSFQNAAEQNHEMRQLERTSLYKSADKALNTYKRHRVFHKVRS